MVTIFKNCNLTLSGSRSTKSFLTLGEPENRATSVSWQWLRAVGAALCREYMVSI